MARWSATFNNFTPVAVADTTGFTNAGQIFVQGGSSTQRINIWEVFMGGLATSSTVNQMVLAHDSTVAGATISGGTFAALDPATAALAAPPLPGNATSGTKAQRSATLYLLVLGFNTFGGIVRWVYAPGEEIGILGNTASVGEVSLSSVSGVGPLSAHIIIEPY